MRMPVDVPVSDDCSLVNEWKIDCDRELESALLLEWDGKKHVAVAVMVASVVTVQNTLTEEPQIAPS